MTIISQVKREYLDSEQQTAGSESARLVIQSELLLVLCVQVCYAYSCSDCTLLFSSDLEKLHMHICLMLDSFVVLENTGKVQFCVQVLKYCQ